VAEREGVAHRKREAFARPLPVHVTMRMTEGVPYLRERQAFIVVARAFWNAQNRFGTRLTHFSVQGNHVHVIVESADSRSLARAMKGLAIRIALGINGLRKRDGRVIDDRYDVHILRTPTEVRHAVRYVLKNHEHHRGSPQPPDSFSSEVQRKIVLPPRTWLLRHGRPPP
jgi:REP element-mobilizing transposase RayT